MWTKNQDLIARIEKSLTKKLFKEFCAGSDYNVIRRDGNSKFFAITFSNRFAKIGESKGRAIVSLMAFNGPNAGRSSYLRRGKRAVPDLQFDHVLALGLERLGDRQNVESCFGVETLGKSAESEGVIHSNVRLLKAMGAAEGQEKTGLLLSCDRLGQRTHDRRDNVRIH